MGGKSTTTTNADPWEAVQPQLKDLARQGQRLANNGGFAADPYQGSRVGGFGNTSQEAMGMIRSMARDGAPGIDTAINTLTGMMNGTGYSDLATVKKNALGSAIPAATAMFSGSGLADSTMAMDTVGRAAAEAVAPIDYGAWQDQQNRALSAAGMMPQMEQARYIPAQMLQSVGTMQDLMRQARIDSRMEKYYEKEMQNAENLRGYAGLLTPLGGMGGQSNSVTKESPGIMDILGTGLQLFGLFSDRRVKENIRFIGTHRGHNVYAYNYLWSPTIEVGVMADEVPHAVAGHVDGYAVVDYTRL